MLRILDLSGQNNFGSLPDSIFANLRGVETLNLANAGLTGAIPSSIFKMVALTTLTMWGNAFSNATFAGAFSRLTSLQSLDASQGAFTGVDSSICGAIALQALSFGNNPLSGSIPACVGQLTALTTLDLSASSGSSGLSGPIPAGLNTLTNLWALRLSRSPQLSGYLNVTRLTSLTTLNLASTAAVTFDGNLLCSTTWNSCDVTGTGMCGYASGRAACACTGLPFCARATTSIQTSTQTSTQTSAQTSLSIVVSSTTSTVSTLIAGMPVAPAEEVPEKAANSSNGTLLAAAAGAGGGALLLGMGGFLYYWLSQRRQRRQQAAGKTLQAVLSNEAILRNPYAVTTDPSDLRTILNGTVFSMLGLNTTTPMSAYVATMQPISTTDIQFAPAHHD